MEFSSGLSGYCHFQLTIDNYWEYQLFDATVSEKVDWNGNYRIVFDNPENFSDYGDATE
jgi:hypothetical protein